MRQKIHLIIYIAVATIMMTGCTDSGSNASNESQRKPQPSDTLYTVQTAMAIYGYQPERALQIIDSAVIVGNTSKVQAEQCRARVYAMSLMKDQLDSLLGGPKDVRLDTAQAIGERLLRHDSVKVDLKRKKDVLEVLVYTERMQNDTIGWMQRSYELIDVCRLLGADAEIDALRTEAEIGAALHALGQYEEGMTKLDNVIDVLTKKPNFKFNELDALIIALKRKILLLSSHDMYDETLPLIYLMLDLLDKYEKNPDAYHDDSLREPNTDENRIDYIAFYRNQALNYMTAAYAALGERDNVFVVLEKIERGVRDVTAREHIARYRALENQMKREAAEIHSRKMTQIAIVATAGLVSALIFACYIFAKNRIINKKNRGLVKLIDENIKLKAELQSEDSSKLPVKKVNGSPLFVRISTDIREQQLYLDPTFDRQAICKRFNLTPMQVGNAFAQGSDYDSVANFIRECRLEHACQLLKTTDMKIADVAARSGFSRVTTFNHDFKAHYNLSPSEYRQQQ